MKKLMALFLVLVLAFTVTAVGLADSGIYNGSAWSGDITGGSITIEADAVVTEVTSVTISWDNNWDVSYTWTEITEEGEYSYSAWVAEVDTDEGVNEITFEAVNDSSRAKTVKATWANATETDKTPGDYGLAVELAGDLAGTSGAELGYQGSTDDSAECKLTLAEKAEDVGVSIAGQATYDSIVFGMDNMTLGTMTFSVT